MLLLNGSFRSSLVVILILIKYKLYFFDFKYDFIKVVIIMEGSGIKYMNSIKNTLTAEFYMDY